ncbi:hypothetical protein ABB37_07786 [Leptomonas pyrrhocoris]|uniref:Uncharacterized protein n=1 Tax=Leptomonas pyrrhocoris TaxID=157538 RepID=A0A0M9FUQ4_LEPPY|nr:hypothetical protein ABB37_07786 [Leptomonas pyrrhocoris]KPA76475.1 hypothetical protein ABB37_07786 [Leptomonas pyrrhocoris]|eukprot:XP_015654914.1 hypothetical protein ABB37_07786 [Leptomonas pyrrhocoris]
MKRNSVTVHPAPRSFEELKLERSGAGNTANNGSSNNSHSVHPEDETAGSTVEATSPRSCTDGPQPSHSSPVFDENMASSAAATAALRRSNGGVRHRYDTGDDDEAVVVSAPHSLSRDAGVPLAPAQSEASKGSPTSGGGGGEGTAHEARRVGNAHGIDLSKSPTTAALAAGARAAGAAQPFFFSLKLPSAPTTHIGAARTAPHQATTSLDNSTSFDSPYGNTTAAGERRDDRLGGHAWTASVGSPHRLDGAAGTTPRIPSAPSAFTAAAAAAAAAGEGDHKGTVSIDSQSSPAFFPRDVGPLPATRTRARNRLPSGTHIGRRPRSVANRRTGDTASPALALDLLDSTDNVNLLSSTVYYGSPAANALDTAGAAAGGGGGGTAGRGAPTPTSIPRPRGSYVAMGGQGVGVGGGGGRGAGHARGDVLLPGGTRTAAAVPHRRRADPSPAPSRPPRARKGAAVMRATNNSATTPGSPALCLTPAPTVSPSSPLHLELARTQMSSSGQSASEHCGVVKLVPSAVIPSASQQRPILSIPNSPGASSPVSGSLETRCLFTNDKDAATPTTGTNNRGVAAGGSAAKPPSGRLVGDAAALTPTPRTSIPSLRGVEVSTPLRQDYSKLAERYIQLCSAVGELPNEEWISGLQSTENESGQRPQRHNSKNFIAAGTFSGEAATGAADVKELDVTRMSSNVPVSTTAAAAAKQSTSTPRGAGGGARQRGSSTTAATPRARTPVASRAKSPGGGTVPSTTTTTTNAPAKRSGSVGRITTVNRASILGSSISQAHGTGAGHTPRTRGTTSGRSKATAATPTSVPPTPRETMADVYAQRISRYCAEHLYPYVDSMKHLQQQQQTLDEVLQAFLNIAASVMVPSASSHNDSNTAGEAPYKSSAPLPVNPAHLTSTNHTSVSHSHRGPVGSGKGVPAASSPVPSSLGTTPRKLSASRKSVPSPLPNTASAAAATAIVSRRSATTKAASLTDGLQNVQGAVVALLSVLADGTRLAHRPATNRPSPANEDELTSSKSQSFSKFAGPLPPMHAALVPLGAAMISQQSTVSGANTCGNNNNNNNVPSPADRSQTLAQLIPTPSPSSINEAVPGAPFPTVNGPASKREDAAQSPLSGTAHNRTPSTSALEGGTGGGASATMTTLCPPPIRFVDFVEAQERSIAVQLRGVCETVRAALGTPAVVVGSARTAAAAAKPMKNAVSAAEETPAGSLVQLEHADMLDNPFFVPNKYLQNLAATLASSDTNINGAHTDDEAAAETHTPKRPSQGDTSSVRKGTKPAATTTTKSAKTATKKAKSAKSSGGLGGGGGSISGDTTTTTAGSVTGRSSAESTPRHRASLGAFAPLFTVQLSTEDAAPSENDNTEPQRRSISSSSTENNTTTGVSGNSAAETFVLHCIQPTTAAATGLTPRRSVDGDVASGRQNSLQYTVTDLAAASAASIASNTAAASSSSSLLSATTAEKSAGGKTSKRAKSAGVSNRGGGAGQRSKSSGASTRVGTATTTTASAATVAGGGGAASSSDTPRTALVAPWLTPQGGRGSNASGASSSGKKPRKKSGTVVLNSTLSGSTGGLSSTSTASVAHTRLSAHGHRHTQTTTAAQVERQRQLATAWKMWNALEHRFVSSRKASGATRPSTPDVAADGEEKEKEKEKEERECAVEGDAAQQFSLRPCSASPIDTLSTSPRVRVAGAMTATADNSDASTDHTLKSEGATSYSTPPTAKASTAAATPAQGVVVEVPEVASTDGAARPGEEDPDAEMLVCGGKGKIPFESITHSPNQQLEGTISPSGTAVFGQQSAAVGGGDAEDEGDGNTGLSATCARIAENMSILSSGPCVPRRLDLEETTALPTQSDLPTESASQQSSATIAPHTLSVTMAQDEVLASASALTSAETLDHSAATPLRVTTVEEEKAAQHIVDWWVLVRERRRSVAQVRAAHAVANERQHRKVMEGRVRHFLLRCVCRLRLRRRARDAADVVETRRSSSSNKQKPIESVVSPFLATLSPTVAATSREKFLRSKEQRRALAAGGASAAVATPATSGSSLTSKDGKDSGGVGPIPPLPLVASGISTFAMGTYESDSSFTVAAIHRLLHAPPSLLHATCTVALHYPTHPPMAYLDNTTRAKSNEVVDEAERQQSEAPPAAEARLGAGASSTYASRSNGASTAPHERLWRMKGVCFVRLRDLREYPCGEYAARIPPRTVSAAMDGPSVSVAGVGVTPLDVTVNALVTSYRGGSRQQTSATTLFIPATMRYDSVVDPDELHHRKPVSKSFLRPFEQWGMAYHLNSRVFCAAAIYAWQLIFSHTPFDDAKQRELPTREERQVRLERVADRNDIILDCYGVRSEREWMREATKDLSFVGQIYVPHYPDDDPAQEKECRCNYDFVKDFLFQCFPNINKLSEIPDFLVGAGIYFVLKEVFHMSKDAPLTRRLQKYVPHILVKAGEDYLHAITPASSPLYAGADDVGSDEDADEDENDADAGPPLGRAITVTSAAPTSLATPRATDYGKGGNGLSGLQRAALNRYEQLRQLYHLSYGMLDEEERAACAWGGVPLRDKIAVIQAPALSLRPPSGTTLPDNDKIKSLANDDRYASEEAAFITTPMRRFMAHSGAGPVTPLRATPTTTALSSAFNTPAAMREGPRRRGSSSNNSVGTAAANNRSTSAPAPSSPKHTLPPRESDIQLAHVPHRLLRSSAADAQFVREFAEEVSKSVRRIVDSVAGCANDLSLNATDLPAALTAAADVHDALDIAYPDHFLVKLSEMLAFELYGLKLSLGSCEDLDSTTS